jgi:hypothetical protein
MSSASNSKGTLPAPLFSQLDARDAALWLAGDNLNDPQKVAQLSRLPWNLVVSEYSANKFIGLLEETEDVDGLLVQRRGLVHVIDTDPAELTLPPRHLGILLLNGREGSRRTGLAATTRRLTMLAELRKRSIRQLVVVISGEFAIPDDLQSLWDDGYRTILTFVSDDPLASSKVQQWSQQAGTKLVDLIQLDTDSFSGELCARFFEGRSGSVVIRVRGRDGSMSLIDVSTIDDPERPLLRSYELIGNEAVSPLMPSDLSAKEVDGFFGDSTASWRPYAAGMAWDRDPQAWEKLRSRLRNLDRRGPEENAIFYVPAESGAGATTFLRDLGFKAAELGYPVLLTRRGPLDTSALEATNFLTRLANLSEPVQAEDAPPYEAPCLLIFDQEHWSGRESELVSFAREIQRSGRRACIIFPTSPYVGLGIMGEQRFLELTQLTHEMSAAEAMELGRHLNRYLAPHGTAKSDTQWRSFFQSSSVDGSNGVAAFWIVLSFWLQRQIDLGETVQSRVYKQFKDAHLSKELQTAVLRIAAFSTVRTPLPDALLPAGEIWPVSDQLQDIRKEVGALGLIRIKAETDRSWAMAHDLLGRYIISSLFYDYQAREDAGYAAAMNPEHLRFLILREISALRTLQRSDLRDVAEAFSVSIFKIDPDHGHGNFAPFWRDVLDALDEMPSTVRTTSRTILHHMAISRRRIAADPDTFPMPADERVSFLQRAISDIEAALRLEGSPGAETEINLYNSLAHAYHDLADAERDAGLDTARVSETRAAAQDATRRAFALNPDNSFVVETYVRNLLSQSKVDSKFAIQNSLEALNLVYAQMEKPASEARRNALGRLAEQAFDRLMEQSGFLSLSEDQNSETGAIASALSSLGADVDDFKGMQLSDYPEANRRAASLWLAVPVLAGNVQAVKLRYMLLVLDDPINFESQLELLQTLEGSGPAFTPQMRLEMAALLFQQGRFHEGDRLFRNLRELWRRGEHYVEVPQRLHWLLDKTLASRKQVRATVAMRTEGRTFARVDDFQGIEVPFRSPEFTVRSGEKITAFVSFGHNGPLLRPLTALPK